MPPRVIAVACRTGPGPAASSGARSRRRRRWSRSVSVPAFQLRPRIVESLRPSTQSSICLYGDHRHAARLCRGDDRLGAGWEPGCRCACWRRRRRSSRSGRARCRAACRWWPGTAGRRLVGHVRVLLLDVDRRPVEVGEAHREAAAVHEAGLRADPAAGVVVVVPVQPDSVRELHLGLRGPSPASRRSACGS